VIAGKRPIASWQAVAAQQQQQTKKYGEQKTVPCRLS
jgi:hypothetical protein